MVNTIVSTKDAADIFNDVEALLKGTNLVTATDLMALVPTGTTDDAVGKEGTFGVGGIHKYCFKSSDGKRICVKYHKPDVNARFNGGCTCHSFTSCTFQITIGHKLIAWDEQNKSASLTRRASNETHIPMEDFAP